MTRAGIRSDAVLEGMFNYAGGRLRRMAQPLVCEQCHKPFENMRAEKKIMTVTNLTVVCAECGHTTVLNGEFTSD
jgi:RNase P subunit RPR2